MKLFKLSKIFSLVSLIIIFLNVFYFKNIYLGIIFFILWLFFTGILYENIILKYFKSLNFTKLLGIFSSLVILTFFGAIFIVFYKITKELFIISLIFTTIIPIFFKKTKKIKEKIDFKNINYYLISGLLILFIIILYYLFNLEFSNHITIYPFLDFDFKIFIVLFEIIFFSLLLIFLSKKINKNVLIFFIIIINLFTHLFIPAIYQKGEGGMGDRFRFIAEENYYKDGNQKAPVLFGEKEKIDIPYVFYVGNKQTYSNKQALNIFTSWMTGAEIFYIDIWILYLIFSIFSPILIFNLVNKTKLKEKYKLLFCISPLFLNTLWILGSLGYASTYGFLVFLLVLIFNKEILFTDNLIFKKRNILIIFISMIFLYFNYILYLILYFGFLLYYLILKNIKNRFLKYLVYFSSFFYLIFFDLISGLSYFSLKKTNLSLKPDIILNNINKYPKIIDYYTFFFILFLIISILGIILAIKNKKYKNLNLFSISLLANYIISPFILNGANIFNNKSIFIISFILLFYFIYSISNIKLKNKYKISFILLITIFISFLSVTQISSGPVMEITTGYKFDFTNFLKEELKEEEKYCVIGDTMPLIMLEYQTKNKIINGGFPQKENYKQKERKEFFKKIIKNPSKTIVEDAIELTKAKNCYLIIEDRNITDYLGTVNLEEKYQELLKVFSYNLDFENCRIFIY
ncbi:oligosaccharide repeat unit polymerase [Patescibacteria group bacterium]|nr:oligosaccharide repeat unit polymerase [Patescibacteria group bacterium]